MEHYCKVCDIKLKIKCPTDYNLKVKRHENSNKHQKNIGNKLTGVVYLYTHNDKAYVGSSTNISERRMLHNQICFNKNEKYHRIQFYVYIRENNLTFDDLHFEVIEEFIVDDESELKQHEQNYIDIFKEHYTLLNCFSAYLTDEIEKEKHKERNKKSYEKNKSIVYLRTLIRKQTTGSVKEKCDNCGSVVTHNVMVRHKRSKHCINYKKNFTDPNYIKCDICTTLVTKESLFGHKKTDKCKEYIKQL